MENNTLKPEEKMKELYEQYKTTLKRLAKFAESYDTDIIFVVLMSVLLAVVIAVPIAVPIMLNKIAWAFCTPLALILVYMIVRGILDLIDEYRWYFGIDKDNKKKNTKQ